MHYSAISTEDEPGTDECILEMDTKDQKSHPGQAKSSESVPIGIDVGQPALPHDVETIFGNPFSS
jgi:hypothetical protein